VRQRALETLHQLDSERGFRLLLSGLRDEDSWIREAAIAQLITLTRGRQAAGFRRAVPALVQAASDDVPSVSKPAMGLLRKITGKPWFTRASDSEAQFKSNKQRWREWWAANEKAFGLSDDLVNPPIIRPTRVDPA